MITKNLLEHSKKLCTTVCSVLLILCLIGVLIPVTSLQAEAASESTVTATLSFSDSEITVTKAGSGYSIDGTSLTISAAGVYELTGSCSGGCVEVSKDLNGVVLILNGLELASSDTAPIVIKKNSSATIHLEEGTASTITDLEDPENESSTDTAVADAFEGAAIKVKSGSSLTFCGSGTLTADGSFCKNGIKGGASSNLVFNEGTFIVKAANNGIAADGTVTINGGTYDIDADNDGIKSVPDSTDADSTGSVFINGGIFDLDVSGDGIQAETKLQINNGDFDIRTMCGYNTSGTKVVSYDSSVSGDSSGGTFTSDTMSCKGLKASGDREGIENDLEINGGTFVLNTADDAIHSDAYCEIYGGLFTIDTGDDGAHADTSLTLGADGSTVARDPDITINHSYEGLEAGNLYLYQGRYYVAATDDGINAAGGSGSGEDPGSGGDPFNPGGGPGGPGGGSIGPGGGTSSDSGDYSLNIAGGSVYINCDGDGLDSNGTLSLTGGTQIICSMKSGGDNSAIDADGAITIDGAEVFTAGTSGVDGTAQSSWFGSSQKYAVSTNSFGANTNINVTVSGETVFSTAIPKASNYTMYSAPGLASTPSITAASSVTKCKGGSWSHSWNDGTEGASGLITYTCTDCGATETRTAAASASYACSGHAAGQTGEEEDEGYTITFAGDEGVQEIYIYYTQDYTEADETIQADGTTVSRNSDTGEPDSTGSGQLNFQIILNDGYSLSDVSLSEGTYKNLKGPSDTGQENTYRATKITGETTVTITTVQCAHENVSNPEWTWADDYSAATLSLDCTDCGNQVSLEGTITSELTENGEVSFTATCSLNAEEYKDIQTASPYTGTFSTDEGVESIDLHYTQDYSSPDETDIISAVARDSSTGNPVITGDGQINFKVNLKDGYQLQQIVIEGLYNKLKDQGENIWRITKVSEDLQITISTEVSSDSSGEDSGTDDTSGEDSGTNDTSGEDSGTNDTSTENTNDQEAADAAIAKINALTSSSTEAEVKEARTAFDNLTDTQKKLVSQEVINKLTSAEARIAKSQSDLLTSNGSASDSTGAIIGMSYTVAGQKYLVTGTNTVTFTKAKNVKSVTVPAAVTIKGNTYKVTRIAAKAFTGSKIRRITIGKNVSKITKNAFAKSKATKLILKTKLLKKTSVKGSLKGSKIKTVQVKAGSKTVNRKFVKAYKKIFTKKIAGKKVSVK